jgi:hypothetical protein
MTDIPKPQGAVLRRNPERECGTPIGQVNAVVHKLPGFHTISFYCNLPRLHSGECIFLGTSVVVRRRET